MTPNNIQDNIIRYSFDVTREEREKRNNQKAVLLWFTGLSGSGKSTIANKVEFELFQNGNHTYILDGDNTRKGINSDLDFSESSRKENIRRVGELAYLMVDAGLITLASFISPFEKDRENIRQKLGERFVEIYVECPLEICEQRDVKGLYAKARKGEIKNFTGIDSPFEIPKNPNIVVNSHLQTLEENVKDILEYLRSKNFIS